MNGRDESVDVTGSV